MELELETPKSYVGCCVELKGDDITDMVDVAIEVTAKTFKKNISTDAYKWLSTKLGYSGLHFTLEEDYTVSFHRSKYKGKRCYYCRWSAIEYVFVV
jgi:hypothetical protein